MRVLCVGSYDHFGEAIEASHFHVTERVYRRGEAFDAVLVACREEEVLAKKRHYLYPNKPFFVYRIPEHSPEIA